MKAHHLLAMSATMLALPVFAAAGADAQQRAVGGARISFPSHGGHFKGGHGGGKHGFHGGFGSFGGVWIVEREVPVVVEREVVREAPPPAPSPEGEGKAPPRKPYVIGSTYASLPGGCMKMIDDGVSYYYCGGEEWYRQLGGGRGGPYKAVAKP